MPRRQPRMGGRNSRPIIRDGGIRRIPRGSDEQLDPFLLTDAEDALVTLDFVLRAHGLGGIVGKFHGRAALGLDGLADKA